MTVLHVSTHYIMFELWRDLLTVVAGLSVLIGLKASEMSAVRPRRGDPTDHDAFPCISLQSERWTR